jgi:hypothetical protein
VQRSAEEEAKKNIYNWDVKYDIWKIRNNTEQNLDGDPEVRKKEKITKKMITRMMNLPE